MMTTTGSGGQGRAECFVDDERYLLRTAHQLGEPRGDVPEESAEIHFLHVTGAKNAARLLTDDGHNRHRVKLGVVAPVEKVNGTGTLGRHDHAHLAGEFRVSHGHERSVLLMPSLNERRLIACAIQRLDETIDPVSAVSEYSLDAPDREPLDDDVRNRLLGHGLSSVPERVPMLSFAGPPQNEPWLDERWSHVQPR
jgi:hypothetical protein